MSFLRSLGRLATGFAQSRIEKSVLGDEVSRTRVDLRSGETTRDSTRVGGLMGAPDHDGDGRSTQLEQQRERDAGSFHAQSLMSMMSDIGGAARDAGGLRGLIDNAKKHAMGAVDEHKARLLIQAMILAAKADGVIDGAERAQIMDHVGDDAEQEVLDFVTYEMEEGCNLRSFLKSVPPDADFRRQVYSFSLMAIDVDTPEEEAHMAALAEGLGLSSADIAGA